MAEHGEQPQHLCEPGRLGVRFRHAGSVSAS
jgi:hypothetical protein